MSSPDHADTMLHGVWIQDSKVGRLYKWVDSQERGGNARFLSEIV